MRSWFLMACCVVVVGIQARQLDLEHQGRAHDAFHFHNNSHVPSSPSEDCNHCIVEAPGGVTLIYWEPDNLNVSAVANGTNGADAEEPYTHVEDGFTFTSPSVYVVYSSLQATYACNGGPIQTLGSAYQRKTIGYSSRFLAYGTLSSPDQRCDENVVVDGFHTIDFSNLYYNPITTSMTTKAGCPPYVNPRLSMPADLTNVDPAWETCQPLYYGAFDPPRILKKAGDLGTPSGPSEPASVPESAPDPIVTKSQSVGPPPIAAVQGPQAPSIPSPTAKVPPTSLPQQANTPAQQANAPAQQANAPAQQADVPAQQADAPAQQANAPTRQASAPAQESHVPNDIDPASLPASPRPQAIEPSLLAVVGPSEDRVPGIPLPTAKVPPISLAPQANTPAQESHVPDDVDPASLPAYRRPQIIESSLLAVVGPSDDRGSSSSSLPLIPVLAISVPKAPQLEGSQTSGIVQIPHANVDPPSSASRSKLPEPLSPHVIPVGALLPGVASPSSDHDPVLVLPKGFILGAAESPDVSSQAISIDSQHTKPKNSPGEPVESPMEAAEAAAIALTQPKVGKSESMVPSHASGSPSNPLPDQIEPVSENINYQGTGSASFLVALPHPEANESEGMVQSHASGSPSNPMLDQIEPMSGDDNYQDTGSAKPQSSGFSQDLTGPILLGLSSPANADDSAALTMGGHGPPTTMIEGPHAAAHDLYLAVPEKPTPLAVGTHIVQLEMDGEIVVASRTIRPGQQVTIEGTPVSVAKHGVVIGQTTHSLDPQLISAIQPEASAIPLSGTISPDSRTSDTHQVFKIDDRLVTQTDGLYRLRQIPTATGDDGQRVSLDFVNRQDGSTATEIVTIPTEFASLLMTKPASGESNNSTTIASSSTFGTFNGSPRSTGQAQSMLASVGVSPPISRASSTSGVNRVWSNSKIMTHCVYAFPILLYLFGP